MSGSVQIASESDVGSILKLHIDSTAVNHRTVNCGKNTDVQAHNPVHCDGEATCRSPTSCAGKAARSYDVTLAATPTHGKIKTLRSMEAG